MLGCGDGDDVGRLVGGRVGCPVGGGVGMPVGRGVMAREMEPEEAENPKAHSMIM